MSAGILSGERFVAHSELLARAARVATGLDSIGVGKGDSVALMLRNDVPFIETSLAAATLGAIPTPINWHWRAEEVAYLLENCGAKALVAHADLIQEIDGAVPEGVEVFVVETPQELAEAYHVAPSTTVVPDGLSRYDDWRDSHEPWTGERRPSPGSMIYTSGTTGRPKGVQRTPPSAAQTAATAGMALTIFGLSSEARTVIPAPMYHSAPNAYALVAAASGAFVVLQPRFDPAELLALIETHRVTHVQLVPTMFIRLLKLPEDVRARHDQSSLENVVHAAAPCPIDVKRRMIEWWGPIINEYYGCTESGAVVYCTSEEWLSHPGTVGRALEGAHVSIYSADGSLAAQGESGDVYVRLRGVADFTYRGDDEKRRSIERHGLITCGDIGYLDGDGFLYLNDRRSDMVISGGVNIYPAEIEASILKLHGVRDCAVFGIPDDEYGEALAAYVELEKGASVTADEVRDHVRHELAGYKVPNVVEFRDALPREDSGKIFKRHLRAPYWEGRDRAI